MNRLELTGFTTRPSQVWGGVRLVPLVREAPVEGLRLHREVYDGLGAGVVELGPRGHYISYIPHGLVADWSGEKDGRAPGAGRPSAAYGTQFVGGDVPRAVPLPPVPHHRMAKRRSGDRLRFLPLHLALEGYLALHFGGPSTAWEEWSRSALRDGLSPRAEDAYLGRSVRGLGDALRIFEIHPGQCGVMVYVSDALAAAFAVPHPDDYRLLHASLVEDLYGELVHQYALYGAPVAGTPVRIGGEEHIRDLGELRAAARAQERAWAEAHGTLFARELLDTSYAFDRVYRMKSFTLWRFLPPFVRDGGGQHIGETITDHKGRVAYLKTFRLSDAQIRRGHLLRTVAGAGWELDRAAAALGSSREELVRRMRAAGFSALLRSSL
ncbi:ARPP-2 domain-containing protein [Streptomyces sindenensis]|uniref:ARG and Rhodanese-Phosphatase-superfamily-associated domain-containing protein n=1 Tax=Streptomyces sindenensis TaxID=67363 RepID=A0ABW6EQI0_9ACTN